MYLFRIISVLVLFASAVLCAQDFSGTYSAYNQSNGTKITMTLSQNSGDVVFGELILNSSERYKLNGKLVKDQGESYLKGSITGEDEHSFFEAYLEENQLIFDWIPNDGTNQPDYNSAVEVVFNKGNLMNNNYGREQNKMDDNSQRYSKNQNSSKNNRYQIDPALVGSWRYSKSYVSGDFSMVTEKYMEVRPDGTYSYGNGKVAGGGNSGSFDSNRGDIITGKWGTENGIIYIDEGGYGNWIPYSGYYVQGNSLMLKFNDGSKEIWKRQ